MHYDIKSFDIFKVEMKLLDLIFEKEEDTRRFSKQANIVRQTFINCEKNVGGVHSSRWFCTVL